MDVDHLAAQARLLTKDRFAQSFPHLFLLFGEGKEQTPAGQFFTEAPPHPPAHWTFSGALQLMALTKAPGSPYPDRISIGRARNCDVVLRHPSVSKLHAHVRHEDGRWMLHDNGSHNGTSVGTSPVTPDKPAELHSGDLVTFGAFTVRVIDAGELYGVLTRMTLAATRR